MLTKESVERQCREMWDALADAPRDEDYDAAYKQALDAERRLYDELARQDRLFAAAPELLEACNEALSFMADSTPHEQAAIRRVRAAIEKAEGKASS